MDDVNYEEKKFNDMKTEVTKLLAGIGYKTDNVKFVPISAWKGDNLVKKTDNMKWWTGNTLLEQCDEIVPPAPPIDKPLRLPIQDVYNIKGVGCVPVGRVETGVIKPGDKIIIMPVNVSAEVKSVEMHHEQLSQATPGDNIGFNLRGVEKSQIAKGDVVGHATSPPTVAKEFLAQIVVLNHPSAIAVGYTPVFHLHTAQIACTFTELVEKKDPKTGAVLEKNPAFLKTGDAAIVKIKPLKPLVVEEFKSFPQLGRFAVRDSGTTVAAGIVLQITQKA